MKLHHGLVGIAAIPIFFLCLNLIPFQQAFSQAKDAGMEQKPDFSGIWTMETWSTEGWPMDPPFTEEGRTAHETWETDSLNCVIPLGRIISAPLPHEIIHQEDRLTILYEYDHQVRRVYMDGRSPVFGKLVLTERLTMVGEDRIRIEHIIDDPVYYQQPWKVTKFYQRGEEEIKDYTCRVRQHLSG